MNDVYPLQRSILRVWPLRLLLLLLIFSSFGFTSPTEEEVTYRLFVFEGSDWCHNCRRLEKEILSQDSFQEFLQTHGIALQKVDFPQRGKLSKAQRKENARIADAYQFQGEFPTLVLAREDEERFEHLSYQHQAQEELQARILEKLALIQ